MSTHNRAVKVVVREFGSGEPVMPKHVHWAAMRDGKAMFGVVDHLEVTMQREDWNYSVTARLMLNIKEGRYTTQAVSVGMSMEVLSPHVRPDDSVKEVTGVLLRTIRVAEIARLGALGGIFVILNRDEPPASILGWLGPSAAFGGDFLEIMHRMGPVKSNLETLSLLYNAATMAGEPPAKAVQRQLGLAPRTAAYWIAKAKSEGIIAPLNFEYMTPPEMWQREYRHPYETRWPDA